MFHIYAIGEDSDFIDMLRQAIPAENFQSDTGYANALAHVEYTHPDIVLLDFDEVGAEGLHFCQTLRAHETLKDIPVIFLSAYDELNCKIRCLEAGADDYMTKPVSFELLEIKFRLLSYSYRQLKTIKADHQTAQQVVMEALRGSSELGQAMQVIERCQGLESDEQIAWELLSLCRYFNLKAVVGLRLHDGWLCLKEDGNCSPIEHNVIESAHEQGRFIDFGSRTQINFPNIALLIKNMPADEPERYGRIKDALPPVLSALDIRLDNLRETHDVLEQTQRIARSIEAVQPNLDTVSERLGKLTYANKQNLSNLLHGLTLRLPRMGLDDDQEDFILGALEDATDLAEDLNLEGQHIRERLDTISLVLKGLLERQQRIAEIVEAKLNARVNEDETTDPFADNGTDVELF